MYLSLFCMLLGMVSVKALANMKQDVDDRSMSVSPPMLNNNNNNGSLPMPFSGMHHHHHHQHTANTAMGLFSPQLLAANQTAAAIMAAGLPMSLRATLASSGLFSPHHVGALFGGWPPQQPGQTITPPTPSPTSPGLKQINHHNNNNNHKKVNNNNHIVSTTTDILPTQKKAVKRKQQQTKKDMEVTHQRDLISPGPISPPTSGSSPQSTDSIEQTTVLSTSTRGHHDISRDKVFTCKICNRSFGYKHVLQNHERTHTGEKPFECPECHKRFTRDHHLKTHMRLHTGEKPYHCSHCDRQFVQVANLRRHLRVHTGERPYQCDVCDARFSDSNQLKAHVLIHNGEKPFNCDRCHARFRRRHHLLHHKCGITSPPTPAISPVMSLSDLKSERSSRSEASDESIDMTKSRFSQSIPIPLDLSSTSDGNSDILEKRNRKSRDIRRLIRLPPQIITLPIPIPEQTEPEDLSMHSPRSPASIMSHDEDLDELDDAATLYLKQKIMHRIKDERMIS